MLSNASANVTVNSNGVAAVCFNSVGRLVANASANVTAVTGGANCVQPTAGVPPVQQFNITTPGADRPLQVNLGLGGEVHMCDPNVTLSDAHPEGCSMKRFLQRRSRSARCQSGMALLECLMALLIFSVACSDCWASRRAS